jgi:UDP-2,4-diacetamido-2,4,6-trideoxy-beta-L-altropyranose hydrolase
MIEPKNNTNFLFRCDASPSIGLGHFMRCLALAQNLQDQGKKAIFLTKTEINHLLDRAKYENIEIIQIKNSCNTYEDSILTKEIAERKDVHWIILDGYNFVGLEYQKVVRAAGKKLLCIDDLAENHFICDAIINQNIGANRLNYSREPYTKLFLGTKYLLVKREFKNLQNWQRIIHKKADNILVTMGGCLANSSDFLIKIVEAINSLQDSTLHVKIILGSVTQNWINLKNVVNLINSKFELLSFEDDMLSLMKWADLVISAAGSTVWELILTYAPMLIFTVAHNQRIIDNFLREYYSANMAGWINNISIDNIAINIRKLIDSKQLRRQLSTNCKNLVKTEFDFFNPNLIF